MAATKITEVGAAHKPTRAESLPPAVATHGLVQKFRFVESQGYVIVIRKTVASIKNGY
jgi:hypothetical protein